VAELPERSQLFLSLLENERTLTMTQAMKGLGVTVPKAMGGITGSIARWAPTRKVELPYRPTKISGERGWEWLGKPATGGDDSPKADASEKSVNTRASAGAKVEKVPQSTAKETTPQKKASTPKAKAGPSTKTASTAKTASAAKKKAREITKKTSKSKSEKTTEAGKRAKSSDEPKLASMTDLERIGPTMETRPARLIAILREQGRVSQKDIIAHLGLQTPKGLSSIINAVGQACVAEGLLMPIKEGFSDDGNTKVYTWPEVYAELNPPVSESTSDKDKKTEAKSAFGVKVRRRRH